MSWTFYAAETTTGRVLDEFPLESVSLGRHLNLGPFRARVNLASLSLARRRDLLAVTREMRSTIVAMHGSLCLGEWLIEEREPVFGQGAWSLGGREFGSYLDAVYVGPWKWTNADQLAMAWALIAEGFAGVPANDPTGLPEGAGAVSVVMPPMPTSGVTRSSHSLQAREATTLRALTTLAGLADGFEWTITPRIETVGGVLYVRRQVELHYPQAGRDTDIVLDHGGPSGGGSVRSFTQVFRGRNLASTVYALGAGEGLGRKIGTRSNRRLLDDGWPRLEIAKSMSTMNQQSSLDAYASAVLAVAQSSEIPPKLKVALGPALELDDLRLGDRVWVAIEPTVELPDGAQFQARVIGWTVEPPVTGDELAVTLDITSLVSAPQEL